MCTLPMIRSSPSKKIKENRARRKVEFSNNRFAVIASPKLQVVNLNFEFYQRVRAKYSMANVSRVFNRSTDYNSRYY